jgi:RES domain-containing protein
MILWRLSAVGYAENFDGGYGLAYDGRWNVAGWPVTYAATSPALCVLEKLVHVEDPALLPKLAMVRYEAPDDLPIDDFGMDDLPSGWTRLETHTQELGSEWLRASKAAILRVPSAVVPLAEASDRNFVINHRHVDAQKIRIRGITPFELDLRLL